MPIHPHSSSNLGAPSGHINGASAMSTSAACRYLLELVALVVGAPSVWVDLPGPGPGDPRWITSIGITPEVVEQGELFSCAWGIEETIMVVPDLRIDRRSSTDPLVIGAASLRSATGVAIPDGAGRSLGRLVLASNDAGVRIGEGQEDLLLRFVALISWSLVRWDLGARVARLGEELDCHRALVAASEDLIGFATPDGRVLDLNPAGRRMVGVLPHEDLTVMEITHFQPSPTAEMLWTQAIPAAIRYGVWTGESRFVAIDGSEIPVLQTIIAHRDASGSLRQLSTVCRDLSERDEVARLRELQRLKDGFVSTVSHELRTPITSIALSLSMLTDEMIDGFAAEAEAIRVLQIAKENADRLARLVDDILDLERTELSDRVMSRSEVTIGGIVDAAVDSIIGLLDPSRVCIEWRIDREGSVLCDGPRIIRVLVNLLTNALKYSPVESPISLRIEQEGEEMVAFSVIDHGIGIRSEDLPMVFEPFWQVDSSASRTVQGSGLGLAIAHRIIERHGGHFEIDSEEGRGSTFRFVIPTG